MGLNRRNNHGHTPLFLAFIRGPASLIENLIKRSGNNIDLSMKNHVVYGSFLVEEYRKVFQISSPFSRIGSYLMEPVLFNDLDVAVDFNRSSRPGSRMQNVPVRDNLIKTEKGIGTTRLTLVLGNPNLDKVVKPQVLNELRRLCLGQKLEWMDEPDESSLDLAVACVSLELLRIVLDMAAHRGHIFDMGKSLIRAVRARDIEIVELLISYGAPLDHRIMPGQNHSPSALEISIELTCCIGVWGDNGEVKLLTVAGAKLEDQS